MMIGGFALLRADVHHEGGAIVLQVACLFVGAKTAHTSRFWMMTLGIADVLPSSDKGSDISCNLLANKALSTQLYGVFFVRGICKP